MLYAGWAKAASILSYTSSCHINLNAITVSWQPTIKPGVNCNRYFTTSSHWKYLINSSIESWCSTKTWIMIEIEMSQLFHLYDYWTRSMTCTIYFCIIKQQTKWFYECFWQANNIMVSNVWACSIQLDNRTTTSLQLAASTVAIEPWPRISPSQM